MRSGELFAGVGGLGMAVDAVFGTKPAWFCEFDDAPSKVLAHHYPDVPNLGDVTKVDFRALPHTHVRAGGFPCQDVSLAGGRRGLVSGTRSGLWSEFARSIAEDRPDWVVIENVGGLLSAEAHSDVEPCPWCLGDDPGEPALRALGAVLGDLAALGFDAEWTSIRASEIGAPHGRLRVFILAWPAERTAPDAAGGGRNGRARFEVGGEVERAAASGSRGESGLTMLPTPIVSDGTGGPKTLEGARFAPQLREIAQLLPTPDAYAGGRGGSQHPDKRRDGGHTVSLADVTEHTLVVPGTDWGPYAAAVARWERVLGRPAPSPVRLDGKGGKARLNPELPEWMMGWPAGWVTAPEIGLTRAQQLKAAGNGVVPQQAAAALRELLARPGVPALETAVAT